jgi:hypothetical protein
MAVALLVQGQYRWAGGTVLTLLLFLTVTGVIPGMLVDLSERRRAHKLAPSFPPEPKSSSLPSITSSAVSELLPKVRESSAHKEIERDLCPTCGHVLRRRVGRFGPFLGCSAYPRCRYTKSAA